MISQGFYITTIAKFTALVSGGNLKKGTQYLIVDESMFPDTKFKGVFTGANYDEAMVALETAFPTATSGDWAILNATGLPPRYAIWDADEEPAHWAMGGNVVAISINNEGHNVELTLDGSVLSADLKDEENYLRQRVNIDDWNNLETIFSENGLGTYIFDDITTNLPEIFGEEVDSSTLTILGRASEQVYFIAHVWSDGKRRLFIGNLGGSFLKEMASTEDLSNYLQTSDVIDNLTSDDTDKPLSANMGNVIYNMLSTDVWEED